MLPYSMSGKVALVTGASSGIGRGIALNFAKKACKLTIADRDLENLLLTKSQCLEHGLSADAVLVIEADMMKNEDVERILTETIETFGQLDILINNAGMAHEGTIESFSMELYHELMQVNLHSVVLLTKLSIPHLEKAKGSVVNVSSMKGFRPSSNSWAYNMTKAALDHFCRSISVDLAPRGIRVNNVNPAVILTNIHTRGGRRTDDEYRQFLDHARTKHAMQRAGEVAEVASVVSFLVSEEAGRTTGATVLIDGGRHAMTFRQPLGVE